MAMSAAMWRSCDIFGAILAGNIVVDLVGDIASDVDDIVDDVAGDVANESEAAR